MQTYALAIMLILLRFSSIGFSSCSRFCCFRCSSFTDARSFPTSSKFMPLIFSPIQSFSSSHIFWNSSMLNTHTHTHTHTHTGRGGLVVVQRERSRDRTPLPTKVFFSRKSLRYAALGMGCTLTAVPMSTHLSPSKGR